MRILYVINGFDPGGAEHGLLTLVRGGFFDGQDLRVLSLCRGEGQLAAEATSLLGESLLFASQDRRLTMMACLAGVSILWRELRGGRVDAMVLSLKQANLIGRAIALLAPSVWCVSFEHIAQYRARRAEWFYEVALRVLSGRVDEIWADCAETLRETDRYFKPRRRNVEVVPLFVVDPRRKAKENYNIGKPIHLAAAGRLVPRKRFDVLILAMAVLRAQGLPTELDIYGTGPDQSALQALASEIGMADAIRLHGYDADWITNATQADVFVNMSEIEGFCIVVAEAMAAGLPVIATDVGGIRDYGRQDENMLKLKAGAGPRDLAATLTRLAASISLRHLIGEQGRRDMGDQYSTKSLHECGRRIFYRMMRHGQ